MQVTLIMDRTSDNTSRQDTSVDIMLSTGPQPTAEIKEVISAEVVKTAETEITNPNAAAISNPVRLEPQAKVDAKNAAADVADAITQHAADVSHAEAVPEPPYEPKEITSGYVSYKSHSILPYGPCCILFCSNNGWYSKSNKRFFYLTEEAHTVENLQSFLKRKYKKDKKEAKTPAISDTDDVAAPEHISNSTLINAAHATLNGSGLLFVAESEATMMSPLMIIDLV